MDFKEFGSNNYSTEYVGFDRDNLECESTLAQADSLIKAGQTRAAVELLVKILQYNPQFGKAYNYLGWIYETQYQNYTYAEECYRNAMKYTPDYAPVYLNYAYLLLYTRRFDELKAHLDRALAMQNVSKDRIYNNYGLMYEMQQNPEAALSYYVQAVMSTIDTNMLPHYKEAIERCKTKIELKNSLNNYRLTN
ncbi:MAG: tetratricopeptide repeat protein [Fischerella sp.]|nr:tetratricopeptide repeat protein [Fischerella sp.]